MSHAWKQVLDSLVLSRYRHLVSTTVPSLVEARIAWTVENKIPNFVLSAEGARCDAAMIIGPDPDTFAEDPTTRLFQTIEQFQGQDVALPLDVKIMTAEPVRRLEPYGYIYRYRCTQTTWQTENIAFFLVCNPSAPNHVAVVPRHAIHRQDKRGGTSRISNNKSHLKHFNEVFARSVDELEPFPQELLPFVVPLELLPQALRECERCYLQRSKDWRNPDTGLIIGGLPRLNLVPVECMLPADDSFLTDHKHLKRIWSAFALYSQTWRVERRVVRAGSGDFQLVAYGGQHKGTRVLVEIKSGVVKIQAGGNAVAHGTSSQGADPTMTVRRYFSPLVPADFLLSLTPTQGLFISFDDPPLAWFKSSRQERLVWTPGRPYLDFHLVPWGKGDSETLVDTVEAILGQYFKDHGSLSRQKDVPFAPLTSDEFKLLSNEALGNKSTQTTYIDEEKEDGGKEDEGIDDEEGEEDEVDNMIEASALDKHNDHRVCQVKLHAKIELFLKHQCIQKGFGWIYHLRGLGAASLIYTPTSFRKGNPLSLIELSPSTPTLYLNFALVDLTDEDDIRYRHGEQFRQALDPSLPSLYILLPSKDSFEGHNLNCFIVPSSGLNGDGVLAQHVLGKNESRARSFHLSTHEAISVYRCPENRIIDFIENLCRGQLNYAGPMAFLEKPQLYTAEHLDKVFGDKLEALQRVSSSLSPSLARAR